MLLARGRSHAALGPLLLACGAQLVLFNVWFEFGERHREFAIPFLLLLVAAGIARGLVVPQVGDAASGTLSTP